MSQILREMCKMVPVILVLTYCAPSSNEAPLAQVPKPGDAPAEVDWQRTTIKDYRGNDRKWPTESLARTGVLNGRISYEDTIAWLAVRVHDNKISGQEWELPNAVAICDRLRVAFYGYYPNSLDRHSYLVFADPRRPVLANGVAGIAVRDDLVTAEVVLPMQYVIGATERQESPREMFPIVAGASNWHSVFEE